MSVFPLARQVPLALALALVLGRPGAGLLAQTNQPFDGRKWNISTGNLSVTFIQASPMGSHPRPGAFEPPPSVESQRRWREMGLVANEDYIAWGAVERTPGQWEWKQHDAVEQTLHQAGLKYVVYDWAHFPPLWLRENQKDRRTLMRCLEHNQETFYLSVFDPRTLDWYDHFYRALSDHFGSRIDDVYACILGPYGEGNYPLNVPDWVNIGHCHEGYWCGDEFAVRSFQAALKRRYARVSRLNRAWGATYGSFEEIRPPRGLSVAGPAAPDLASTAPSATGAAPEPRPGPAAGGRPDWALGEVSPEAFRTPQEKRRWLDFIGWYHQAIIDFAEQSVRTVLKYFPAQKVRLKPGGNARGVNPISWGTYCPGYAKMAKGYGIVLQPADCQGAVFGDKWMGTAYQFYGIREGTEPPGDLDDKTFVRRMFSDASCGASHFFTYQFERHAANTRRYVSLLTGRPGETEVAVYCPTTLYRLGAHLQPTIDAGYPLRDLCEFDVLDEVLIRDGALSNRRYRALILFQADTVEQAILDKMDWFCRRGGRILAVGGGAIRNVEGQNWSGARRLKQIAAVSKDRAWLNQLAQNLAGCSGVDGKLDGLWTCRRAGQVFVFNSTDKDAETELAGESVKVPPYTIWSTAGHR